MAIDYKNLKFEKVLDKNDNLLHFFVQYEFTDGTTRLAYDTHIPADKADTISNEVEKWLSEVKVQFEAAINNKPVDPEKERKRVVFNQNVLTIDKQKVLNATAESIEEEIKP